MTDTKLTDLTELAATAAGDYAYVVDVSDTADDAAGSSRKVLLSNLLPDGSVTYAKLQNVSATDKILGRATSGAGGVEEIACTAAGRALLDDADASAQRATLGLGTLATQGGTFSGSSSGANTGDQNVFSTVSVSGQSDLAADSTGDTLTLVAGSNVTITTDASADSVTISASGGYATAQEEGTPLTQRAAINFVGSGLTAADDAGNSRTNVGVQATLNSLASDGSTSGTLEKTGATTVGTYIVTAAAKTVLDDASVSAMRTTLGVAIGSDVQAHDAELAALAGLTSAADKLPYFTGSGTAALADFSSFGRSLADDADAAAARTTLGVVIGTDVQAYDADLSAVAGLSSAGLVARTGAGTAAARTITAPAAGISVSNADGASGNPTLALANDLAALEGLSSTGLAARTGTDSWAQRSLAAGTGLSVSNADGASGNPTLSLSGGKQTVWVPAAAMRPSSAGGCAALALVATSSNQPDLSTLDFDASSEEYAQFWVAMPKSWNEGTVAAQFLWSHASTSTNFGVVWGLQGLAIGDDDTIGAAYGTAQTAADTGGTTNDLYISAETGAVTVGGTPAEGDVVALRVYRKAADASDTLAIDARLHGVKLLFATNAGTDD